MGRSLSEYLGTRDTPAGSKELAENAEQKRARLDSILKKLKSVLVAFSGGVDSSYLAYEAHRVLGDKALAVTGESPSYPDYQRRLAERIVSEFGIHHICVPTGEMDHEAYRVNDANRCYHCKNELFTRLRGVADERGIDHVVDGSNADDRGDYRPGRQAAKELGVRSPLDEAELTKDEIRHLSRLAGLPTSEEPASACLSSRIPYLVPITVEKLQTVEMGEEALREMGFRHFRVRHHNELARLEFAPEELSRAFQPETLPLLIKTFKDLGYTYVTVDLEGYRTGSLNETLPSKAETPSSSS
jgi:uncharacterized protein